MTAPLNARTTTSLRILTEKDRRRHKRVSLQLAGRYLNEHGEDLAMFSRNLSCSGAMLSSVQRPQIGLQVVCYFDELGRVSSYVTRHTSDGFAVQFKIPEHKRDKLADRLTWLINKDQLGLADDRAAARFEASDPAIVSLNTGRQLSCHLSDISLVGASFETADALPKIGDHVTAGNLRGDVVRVTGNHFAIRFQK
jgi:PilZ domain